MDSSHITTEQAAKIKDAIGPAVGYLYRLVRRMGRRGFPPDDMLFHVATEAYDKMQHLAMMLHYASVKSGLPSDAPTSPSDQRISTISEFQKADR